MLFTNNPTNVLLPLFVNNEIVNKTVKHKYLGIILDESLTLKFHVTEVCL